MSTLQSSDQPLSARRESLSQQSHISEDSQTAADFLRDQELLEADAREALPYSIDTCTKILGPLRQAIFSCLTCNPPPQAAAEDWRPAGVCYACSVQCHGEHNLVEIFSKRNFTCDCGTTRFPKESPCALRINKETNTKGNVHSEEPDVNNKYNQNFRNIFCGCACEYDPFQQKGTMFQCLGLGTHETGGCGEDWYHPGCLVGMGSNWFENMAKSNGKLPIDCAGNHPLATISEDNEKQSKPETSHLDRLAAHEEDEDPPMPPGFPDEDDFDGFLCHICVDANPWIKRYANTSGFLPAVFTKQACVNQNTEPQDGDVSSKRKAGDEVDGSTEAKRVKLVSENTESSRPSCNQYSPQSIEGPNDSTTRIGEASSGCKFRNLPSAPAGQFSLFFKEGFREQFCHCSDCYRLLNLHPQLLEEEEVYEPPISEDGASQNGGSTHGSGSLLERGESALRNVDRVRAIEGVMAYNHLKEQLKPFFQQFAESGKAVGAEDIKAYFAKLRGDEQGIREAGQAASDAQNGTDGGGKRHEQSGY